MIFLVQIWLTLQLSRFALIFLLFGLLLERAFRFLIPHVKCGYQPAIGRTLPLYALKSEQWGSVLGNTLGVWRGAYTRPYGILGEITPLTQLFSFRAFNSSSFYPNLHLENELTVAGSTRGFVRWALEAGGEFLITWRKLKGRQVSWNGHIYLIFITCSHNEQMLRADPQFCTKVPAIYPKIGGKILEEKGAVWYV